MTGAAAGGEPARDSLRELERQSEHALDALDLSRVLHRFVAAEMDTTGFYLALYDAPSGLIEIVRQMDRGEERPGGAFPLGTGFTSQVIKTRQPLLITHWSESGPPIHVRYATEPRTMPESAVTVPIVGLLTDRVLGVLAVQSFAPEAYNERSVEVLTAFAKVAGRVIESWRARERAQADLRRRTTEMEAILAGMSEGMIITDRRGAAVRFNAVARRLLVGPNGWIVIGAALDQLPGVADASIASALASLVEALRGNQAIQLEIDTTIDEQQRTLSLSATPLGDVGEGIIVIRDVTEARTLDRLRAQVLRVASHDLQSPITAIQGRAQLMLRVLENQHDVPRAAMRQDLTSLVRQTSRLSEMLRMLLDISRMAGDGRLELRRRPSDLAALTAEVVDDLRPVSPDHNFVISTPPSLLGDWDAPRLRQVLQNLIGNAVKYSPDGGNVHIRARAELGSVRFEVADQGIGLAADEIERVFDQFYRADHAARLEGSGLGLFICRAIIAAHGGRIWASSDGHGQGSTFGFVIPA